MNLVKKFGKHIALLSLLAGGMLGLSYYFYQPNVETKIVPFDEKRDTQFVVDLFNRNVYWLWTGDGDYNINHLLSEGTSVFEPDPYEKEHIKMLYVNDRPVGFITYAKTKFYQGKIRLLSVSENLRGKGYGLKLLQHALNDLIARGCTHIYLITRTTNPAQNLYKKAGFVETNRSNGFVRFDYYV